MQLKIDVPIVSEKKSTAPQIISSKKKQKKKNLIFTQPILFSSPQLSPSILTQTLEPAQQEHLQT
jgi:hypothetical protein